MKGSIFKRARPSKGGLKKRETQWCADIELPRGADGRRRRCRLTGFPTRKEAEAAVARKLVELQHGVDIMPTKLTVEGLVERYLANRQQECGERTIERYRELAKGHIIPYVGNVPIRKLTSLAIQDVYSKLSSTLSPRTIHHVHTFFKASYLWAMKKDLVSRSPFMAVDPPTVRSKEMRYLSAEEAATLQDVVENTRWHAPITVALGTGARRGELCALKWTDIDFEAGTITIRAAMSDAGGKLKLKGTKTDRVRCFALSPMALAALRARKTEVSKERLLAGAAYVDAGFVFADPLGAPMVPDAFSKAFHQYATKAKLTGATLHSLRHTAATWMLASGADIRNVQAILGHSVASTTLNIYSHAMVELQGQAVGTIDAKLQAARAARKQA